MRNIDFSSFLGNDEIKAGLSSAIQNNRLPHAIILQGEDGLGKRTLARLLARAVVCSGTPVPCGKCGPCVRAGVGSHPDIKVLEGSGVTGNISVDSIKEVIEDAYRKPIEADVKVFMLFIKSRLLEASQNKLLKIIEEPPGNTLFIITVGSVETLLPTIRSRTQCLTLSCVNKKEAAQYVQKETGADEESAKRLAELHGGNIGRMLGGTTKAAEIATEISNIFDLRDEDALLAATAPLIKDRDLFVAVLGYLEGIFRDAIAINCGGQPTGINSKAANRLAFAYRRQKLIGLPEVCRENIALTGKNINMNLLVTAFCAKLRGMLLA